MAEHSKDTVLTLGLNGVSAESKALLERLLEGADGISGWHLGDDAVLTVFISSETGEVDLFRALTVSGIHSVDTRHAGPLGQGGPRAC